MTLQKLLKTILFIIIAAALLAAAFFLGAFWKENQTSLPAFGPNDGLIENETEPPVMEEISEQYLQAISSGDEKTCESLKEEEKALCKKDIISNRANEKKDKSECDKLKDETEIGICKDSVTFTIASEGDPTACDSIQEEITKQSCYTNAWNTQAVQANDPSKCDNITEQEDKEICKQNVAAFASQETE